MIKINLLPKEKKKEAPVFVYSFLAILFISVILTGMMYFRNKKEIDTYKHMIEEKKAEVSKLEPIYRNFLAIEKEKREILRKIEVIEKIKEGRALAARLLYDIPHVMKDTVWLKNIKKQDNRIEIEGFSLHNESISDFAEAISKIPYLVNIELKNVQEVQEMGFTVKKFIIHGNITS